MSSSATFPSPVISWTFICQFMRQILSSTAVTTTSVSFPLLQFSAAGSNIFSHSVAGNALSNRALGN